MSNREQLSIRDRLIAPRSGNERYRALGLHGPRIKGMGVVDLTAGDGALAAVLLARGAIWVYGIEEREEFKNQRPHIPDIHWDKSPMDTQLPDGSAHIVVADNMFRWEAADNDPDDLARCDVAMREAYRLIVPGGTVFTNGMIPAEVLRSGLAEKEQKIKDAAYYARDGADITDSLIELSDRTSTSTPIGLAYGRRLGIPRHLIGMIASDRSHQPNERIIVRIHRPVLLSDEARQAAVNERDEKAKAHRGEVNA